jgi:subtilisin family serine protease
MGFLFNPYIIRRIIVYGSSVVVLFLILFLGRGFAQSGPSGSPSLLTFDGIEHALMGNAMNTADRDSNIQLRHEIAGDITNQDNNSVADKQVVYASARDIPPRDESGRPNYVPGQLIVQFRGGVPHRRQDEIVNELGGRILRTLDIHSGQYLVVLSGGLSVPAAAEQLAKLQEVDYAEPNVLHYINDAQPNDQYYSSYDGESTELQRWYFGGIGTDSNLNAEAAWAVTTGNSNIVIAIIDTGVDVHHPDLAANMWTNPNLSQDTNAGYAGDVNGWDFYNNGPDPDPDLGDGSGDGNTFHGTFVAGVAAAVSDNGIGVVGASWYSQIMALKVFTSSGGAPSSAITEAIQFATDHNANIINMSFGSPYPVRSIASAIKQAHAQGIIAVAAAGNNGSSQRSYPASYPYVISVGGSGSGSVLSGGNASNMTVRASFSEYGPKAVDVVAPAVDIVSTAVLSMTDQSNGVGNAGEAAYFTGDGTSFASPLVAGEVALLLSRAQQLGLDGSIGPDTFARLILNATTDLGNDPTGGAHWAGHGRVDYLAAIQQIGSGLVTGPTAPAGLIAKATGTDTVEVNWQDRSDNEQGFLIDRAEKSGGVVGSYQTIAEADHGVTSFSDDTVLSGVTYLYRVAAYNVAATNFASRVAVVTMP